jgi:hypothetical protein
MNSAAHGFDRRTFLHGALAAAGSVALPRSLVATEGQTSRELAVAVDRALAADPKAYPRELVGKCTTTAIAEFQACKPDPAVVKKLTDLPDNTWLEMDEPESRNTPENHHSFPRYRGEGSATYDATARAVVCFAGCGAPDYSCDLWAYKAGANRWFEIWPNIRRSSWKALAEAPADRPPPGCTLGLAYASETGTVYRFTCANTGDEGRNVWETRLLSGKWNIVGREQLPAVPAEGIRITADPVLGGLLSVSSTGTRLFSFRTREWTSIAGDGPKMGVCYALTYLSKAECAMCVGAPGKRPEGRAEKEPPEVQTWLFHSKRKQWERVQANPRPEWYYRGGITYDSLNDVALFGGWKSNDAASGPDVTPGLWVFDPVKKEWHFEKPATGPRGRYEYFAYDPDYNVAVTAGNGHGTWVYRYRRVR